MDLVIGVLGMLALGGVYVALGLADRGGHGCGGCRLRRALDADCLACPEGPEEGGPTAGGRRPAGGATNYETGGTTWSGGAPARRPPGRPPTGSDDE